MAAKKKAGKPADEKKVGDPNATRRALADAERRASPKPTAREVEALKRRAAASDEDE